MPRQVTVNIICSLCRTSWLEGDPPEGAVLEASLRFLSREAKFDLCPDCVTRIDTQLDPIFDQGEPVKAKAPAKRSHTTNGDRKPGEAAPNPATADGKWPCPDPDCPVDPWPSKRGRSRHAIQMHGYTKDQLAAFDAAQASGVTDLAA